jgi:hypothetical protein
MPRIKCATKNCLNKDYTTGYCGYTRRTQIDITARGQCMDYDKVTEEEYKLIVGTDRGTVGHKYSVGDNIRIKGQRGKYKIIKRIKHKKPYKETYKAKSLITDDVGFVTLDTIISKPITKIMNIFDRKQYD